MTFIDYFVYNSLDHHSILRFNSDSNTIEKILYSESILNFQPNTFIHCNVLSGFLFWTFRFDQGFSDANSDGAVNVSDAVWVINYVFVGGDPPGDCNPGAPGWGGNDCCVFTP